jgi:hypothetical protein
MRTLFGVMLIVLNVAMMMSALAAGITIRADTTGELADACSAKEQAKIMFCQGFAQGAISLKLHEAGATKPFCFPKPTPTRAATMSQFVKWVQASPDRRVMSSTDGLFDFLEERYPCK